MKFVIRLLALAFLVWASAAHAQCSGACFQGVPPPGSPVPNVTIIANPNYGTVWGTSSGGTGTTAGVGGTPYTATGAAISSTAAARASHALTAIDDFGAYGDAVSRQMLVTTTTGGAATTISFAQSGSWPAPSFSSLDIGKPIEIAGVGASGAALSTTISAVASTSQIVVAAGASTAVTSTAESVMYGHDDTTALQSAFNASATQPVTIPCGAYRVTSPLTTPMGAVITGRDIHPYYYYPGASTSGPAPCDMLIGDGFLLSGSATAFLTVGAYTHLEGVGVSLQNGPAIPAIYGTGAFVDLWRDYVYGGTVGIDFAYSASPLNQGWSIKDNDVSETSSDCFQANSVSDFLVEGNWFHACGGYTAYLNGSSTGLVIANTLEDSVSGVELSGGTGRISITGNKFDGIYYCDLCFSGWSGNVSITGNFLDPIGTSSGLWLFQNANTGTITAAGNTYYTNTSIASTTFKNTGTLTIPGSSCYEQEPAVGTGGIYDSTATRAVVQPMIESTPNNLPGPYANDAAAATAGVPVGAEYSDTSGVRRKRIS